MYVWQVNLMKKKKTRKQKAYFITVYNLNEIFLLSHPSFVLVCFILSKNI